MRARSGWPVKRGKPIALTARDPGDQRGARRGTWGNAGRRRRDSGDGQLSKDERAELARLCKENAARRDPVQRPGLGLNRLVAPALPDRPPTPITQRDQSRLLKLRIARLTTAMTACVLTLRCPRSALTPIGT